MLGATPAGGRSPAAQLSAQARAATRAQGAIASLSSAYANASGKAGTLAITMGKINAQLAQHNQMRRAMQQPMNPISTAVSRAGESHRAEQRRRRHFGAPNLVTGGHSLTGLVAGLSLAHMVVNAGRVTVEGMMEGGQAREAFRQSGNPNQEALQKSIDDLTKRYGSSAAAVTKEFAEVTPFSHEGNIQALMVSLLEQDKARARQRGQSEATVEQSSMMTFKALDLMGYLKPSNGGEVDADRLQSAYNAIMRVSSMEGHNLRPNDLRDLVRQSGTHAQLFSEEGLTRALFYASDIRGGIGGTQVQAMDRVLSGSSGAGIGKKNVEAMIKAGYATRDSSGRVHAVNEDQYNKDPIQFIADQTFKNMQKAHLDPLKPEDIKKYVDGLRLANSSLTKFITQATNRNAEAQREVETSGHARVGPKDISSADERSTSESMARLKNSFENLGNSIDESSIGQLLRDASNRLANDVNQISNSLRQHGDYTETFYDQVDDWAWRHSGGVHGQSKEAKRWKREHPGEALPKDFDKDPWRYLGTPISADPVSLALEGRSTNRGNVDSIQKTIDKILRANKNRKMPSATEKLLKDLYEARDRNKAELDSGFVLPGPDYLDKKKQQGWLQKDKQPKWAPGMTPPQPEWAGPKFGSREFNKNVHPIPFLVNTPKFGDSGIGQTPTILPSESLMDILKNGIKPAGSMLEEIEKGAAIMKEASSSFSEAGTEAASSMQQQAGTIGSAIGAAFVAKAKEANININVNSNQRPLPNAGPTSPTHN